MTLPVLLLAAMLGPCDAQETLRFPEEGYCFAARDFLAGNLGMMVIIDPDTVQDWRTRKTVPGCRAYAAGATDIGIHAEAPRFYERLLAADWVRTPDPYDMPNEAAIRLRSGDVDCLYHVYSAPLIRTPAEIEVTNSVELAPGEERYNILTQCIPAAPAAPR